MSWWDLAEMAPAMAAGARGVRVRAMMRYRVRGSWGGGREVLLFGERHSEHHNHFRGTMICSFLELIHLENLFWACA